MSMLNTGVYVAQMVDNLAESNPDSKFGRLYSKAEDTAKGIFSSLKDQLSTNSEGDKSKFGIFMDTMKEKLESITGKIGNFFGIDLGNLVSEQDVEKSATDPEAEGAETDGVSKDAEEEADNAYGEELDM